MTVTSSITISKEESDNGKVMGQQEDASLNFNYDFILENHLGQLGKFQLKSFLWLCLPALFHGSTIMSYVFTGRVPLYRCLVPGCENKTSTGFVFAPEWLNNTVPWNDMDRSLAQCYKYNHSWTDPAECYTNQPESSLEKCNRWLYDTTMFSSSIVTDFDMTCEDEWLQTMIASLYMGGMMVGAFTVGALGDMLGRRLTFALNATLLACFSTGSAFSPNVVIFCILRFFSGFTSSGLFLTLFVWGVEAVGKKYRTFCGCIYQMAYAVGCGMVGVVAYFVRDWKDFQLIISVPIFVLSGLYWIVPESTRWLISKERYEEAHQLILEAAKENKKDVPEHLIAYAAKMDSNHGTTTESLPSKLQNERAIDMFRSLVLVKRLAIMLLSWMACNMCYYGLTMSTENLAGDFYLNYGLSILMELPGYFGSIFLMDYFGRRPTQGGSFLVGGFACLACGLVPSDPAAVRTSLSLIGKLFISCAFSTVYSFASELFPTSTRSAAIGLCSVSGRVGAMLAPIIANLGRNLNPALPYIIFAGTAIALGIVSLFFLPESNKYPLPATIQEAIDMEKFKPTVLGWIRRRFKMQ